MNVKRACLMAPIPAPETGLFQDFAQNIPDDQLAADGRELEPHITVLWGFKSDDPAPVSDLLRNTGPISLRLGKTSLFRNEDADVLKVDVESEDLHRLNGLLRDNCDCQIDFPDYTPHLTLAYLKPGTGDKYAGLDHFAGKKVNVSSLQWSPSTCDPRDRSVIYLSDQVKEAATRVVAMMLN